MTTTPATWQRSAAGNEPEYKPTDGITEHDNDIPVYAPTDLHEDLAQRAQDEA